MRKGIFFSILCLLLVDTIDAGKSHSRTRHRQRTENKKAPSSYQAPYNTVALHHFTELNRTNFGWTPNWKIIKQIPKTHYSIHEAVLKRKGLKITLTVIAEKGPEGSPVSNIVYGIRIAGIINDMVGDKKSSQLVSQMVDANVVPFIGRETKKGKLFLIGLFSVSDQLLNDMVVGMSKGRTVFYAYKSLFLTPHKIELVEGAKLKGLNPTKASLVQYVLIYPITMKFIADQLPFDKSLLDGF